MSNDGHMRGIVVDLAEHVGLVKSTSPSVKRYLGVKAVDNDFGSWVSTFVNGLFDDHYDRCIASSLILLSKISCQALPTRLTAKSEVIKRRIHALKLLTFLLDESLFFVKKNNNKALIVLRRFAFPSFMHSAIVAVPAVFKTIFPLYKTLWMKYRSFLKVELLHCTVHKNKLK